MEWQLPALIAFAGYLLGSIPFGILLTRLVGAGDLRSIGSGNIGATNVLRTGNRKLAALTLVLDALKGSVAVLLTVPLGEHYGLIAGLGAFVGHLFPIWLGFKGGKGVATYLGILLAAAWPAARVFAMAWLLTAYFTRFSSLSALVATVCVPIALFALGQTSLAVLFLILSALVFIKHRANIARLLAGTETRIGTKG